MCDTSKIILTFPIVFVISSIFCIRLLLNIVLSCHHPNLFNIFIRFLSYHSARRSLMINPCGQLKYKIPREPLIIIRAQEAWNTYHPNLGASAQKKKHCSRRIVVFCSSFARSRFASAGEVWCSVACQIQSKLPMIYDRSADFSQVLHIATSFWRTCSKFWKKLKNVSKVLRMPRKLSIL